MESKARNRSESISALKSAAFVACAIALSAGVAPAQDRSAQERVIVERQRAGTRGWFGVTVNDNGTIDEHGNPFYDGYPTVTSVEPGSPAEKAGVKQGDVLIMFNDHDMKGSAMALREWLQPGASFVVRLRRDGAPMQVSGTVGTRPPNWDKSVTLIWRTPEGGAMVGGMSGVDGNTMRTVRVRTPLPAKLPPVMLNTFSFGGGVYPFAGAEFIALNPDLSDALGVKREGVLVTAVMEGSPAGIAGLRGGDVVVTADSTRLVNPLVLVRAIRTNVDHSIRLGIVRKNKSQTILLKW